jgi:hypothetical protein
MPSGSFGHVLTPSAHANTAASGPDAAWTATQEFLRIVSVAFGQGSTAGGAVGGVDWHEARISGVRRSRVWCFISFTVNGRQSLEPTELAKLKHRKGWTWVVFALRRDAVVTRDVVQFVSVQ